MDLGHAREVILGWLMLEPAVSVLGGDEPFAEGQDPADFSLLLSVAPEPAVEVRAEADPASSGLVAIRSSSASGPPGRDLGQVAPSISAGRAGLLEARADGSAIVIEHPCYLDGFTRQSFLSALMEVVKARRQVDRILAAMVGNARPAPAARLSPETLSGLPAVTPPVVAPAWYATHVVPQGGIQAWAAPDPSQQPTATLQAGVELQVAEWLGAWARVAGQNGWSGWVDARMLVQR
ncbi:MAG: hypothetical protein HY658_08190 [Actinobacteria bacterium]|nr:hypothetical protein [Actinomycetota bacterium]